MSAQPDFIHKRFSPMRQKTLRNALAQRLRREFPRLGGDRILNLCAEMILEVVESRVVSHDHVRPVSHRAGTAIHQLVDRSVVRGAIRTGAADSRMHVPVGPRPRSVSAQVTSTVCK